MKNLKKFNQFLNEELSPETYDKLATYGTGRGDLRGKRLANTAGELKSKFSPEMSIKLYELDGLPKCNFSINTQSILNQDKEIFIEGLFEENIKSYLIINYEDKTGGLYNLYLFKDGLIENVLLDRKGIAVLTNIFKKKEWNSFTKPHYYPSI